MAAVWKQRLFGARAECATKARGRNGPSTAGARQDQRAARTMGLERRCRSWVTGARRRSRARARSDRDDRRGARPQRGTRRRRSSCDPTLTKLNRAGRARPVPRRPRFVHKWRPIAPGPVGEAQQPGFHMIERMQQGAHPRPPRGRRFALKEASHRCGSRDGREACLASAKLPHWRQQSARLRRHSAPRVACSAGAAAASRALWLLADPIEQAPASEGRTLSASTCVCGRSA